MVVNYNLYTTYARLSMLNEVISFNLKKLFFFFIFYENVYNFKRTNKQNENIQIRTGSVLKGYTY